MNLDRQTEYGTFVRESEQGERLKAIQLRCQRCSNEQTWMLPQYFESKSLLRLRCWKCGRPSLGPSTRAVTP